MTPRPVSAGHVRLLRASSDSVFDYETGTLATPANSSSSSKGTSNHQSDNDDCLRSRKRRFSRSLSSSSDRALPPEAQALKQHIQRTWPTPLFRFRLRSMRRSVSLPVVPVPSELAHARAWAARVSGINIPVTRMMFERQKRTFLARMPETIDERASY